MSKVPARQIAADLLSAANHLDQFGWQRHRYGKSNAPCCASGSLQVVIFGSTLEQDPEMRASDAQSDRLRAAKEELMWHVGQPGGIVSTWNDSGFRTQQQVIDALRGAAKRVFPDA